MAGGSAPADAREDVDAELPHQPRCENGHPLQEGDLVCLECGAAPATDERRQQVDAPQVHLFNDKYQILRPLNAVSGEADLYVCVPLESESGSPSELVIKHYRLGYHPSPEVLDKLVALTSPHCLVPLEVGQLDDRPYEVYEYLRAGTLIDVPREISHTQEFTLALVGLWPQPCKSFKSVSFCIET